MRQGSAFGKHAGEDEERCGLLEQWEGDLGAREVRIRKAEPGA